jgi:hypothetical protein
VLLPHVLGWLCAACDGRRSTRRSS